MKKAIISVLALMLAVGLTLGATGCGKKKVSTDLSATQQAKLRAEAERQRRLREARLRGEQSAMSARRLRELFANQDIHFDYDSYDLRSEAKQILNDKARYMQANAGLRIIVEGHCDERGSNAYNMALGEKRAKAAKAYLVAMGIAPNRIETVSYGEERPIAMGHDEASYARNRRGHFVIK